MAGNVARQPPLGGEAGVAAADHTLQGNGTGRVTLRDIAYQRLISWAARVTTRGDPAQIATLA